MTLTLVSQSKCFEGVQLVYSHFSPTTQCDMRFGIFLPPHARENMRPLPVLYWLSGLTCTEQNFITKAGAQRVAAELGIIIVVPDTSPRGVNIPGDKASQDFGEGAGFYLDATVSPWSRNYRMYSYVTKELYGIITTNFLVDVKRTGIFGHSMGGHGALTIALKNPEHYQTVSAFAPICAPMHSPWGEKAFMGYLGKNREFWEKYDTCALIKKRGWLGPPILVDQGTEDAYWKDLQLQPELLQSACQKSHVKLTLRMQKGYDHSYHFVATFMEDHLRYHASYLE
jgi:S-formylglutathione hydrolase